MGMQTDRLCGESGNAKQNYIYVFTLFLSKSYFLGVYPKVIHAPILKCVCERVLIAALLAIAKILEIT